MGWVRDQSFIFKREGVYDFPPDVQKNCYYLNKSVIFTLHIIPKYLIGICRVIFLM
jgi:hypothetical protein